MFPYRNTLRYTAVIDKWSGYVVPVNGEPGVTKKRNVLPEDWVCNVTATNLS